MKTNEDFRIFYDLPEVKKFNVELPNPHYDKTGIKLLSRWLIVGGTGTGKTNLVMNYLLKTPDIYDGIVVVNAGVKEPLYQCLEKKMEDDGNLVFFTLDTFPTFEEFDKTKPEGHHYLIIFDDLMGELSGNKKMLQKVLAYFTRGRKILTDLMFLSQSYFKVDKSIRNQLTYLSLLKLNSKNDLRHIIYDYAHDVTGTQLIDMYNKATEKPMHSLRIDINSTNANEKFYRNFTDKFEVEVRKNPEDGMEYSVVTPGAWYKPPPKDIKAVTNKRKAASDLFGHFNNSKNFRHN